MSKSLDEDIHPFGPDRELRRRLVDFLGTSILARIVQLSAPVFCYHDNGDPVIVATFVVLEIGPSRHLLTATHAITQNRPRSLHVNIDGRLHVVRGDTFAIHTPGAEPGSANDRLDVTAVRLDASLAAAIPDQEVASFEDLDLSSPKVDSGPLVLLGYPSTKSADGLKGNTFSAFAYPLLVTDGDERFYESTGSTRQAQLAVPADRKNVWAIEGKVTAPKPEGISGGGLWRVPVDDRALSETRLAAIAVEWEQKRAPKRIIGTRMRPILQMLHERHADLRPEISAAIHDGA